MSFKKVVYTDTTHGMGRALGTVYVRAKVSHNDVPEIVLGEAISECIFLSDGYSKPYEYRRRDYTEKQFKKLERELRHDVLEMALAEAKQNLRKLQKAKFR